MGPSSHREAQGFSMGRTDLVFAGVNPLRTQPIVKRTLYNGKLADAPFRSLQWIYLPVCFFIGDLDMGGHAADPGFPFNGRVGEIQAVPAGGKFLDFLAIFTLFHNLVAAPSIELTPLLTHKKAIHSFFDR